MRRAGPTDKRRIVGSSLGLKSPLGNPNSPRARLDHWCSELCRARPGWRFPERESMLADDRRIRVLYLREAESMSNQRLERKFALSDEDDYRYR